MVDSIGNSLNTQISLGQVNGQSLLSKKVGQGNLEEAGSPVGNALGTFGDMLKTQLGQINQLQTQADQAAETYALGGDIELHNVILAAEKAETSMQLALQIRNRLVSAYQEISRMNI